MAWIHDFTSAENFGEKAGRAWATPLGAVSPLWFVFGAATSVGVAYWWMTEWARRAVNVEATAVVLPPTRPAPSRVEILAEALPDPEPELPIPSAPALEDEPLAAAVDDLTRMTGIGPKLSAALADRGVTRFAQIAAWTEGDLAEVDAALSLKGRATREAWVAQARRLAREA